MSKQATQSVSLPAEYWEAVGSAIVADLMEIDEILERVMHEDDRAAWERRQFILAGALKWIGRATPDAE